jgi:hypothetical protein
MEGNKERLFDKFQTNIATMQADPVLGKIFSSPKFDGMAAVPGALQNFSFEVRDEEMDQEQIVQRLEEIAEEAFRNLKGVSDEDLQKIGEDYPSVKKALRNHFYKIAKLCEVLPELGSRLEIREKVQPPAGTTAESKIFAKEREAAVRAISANFEDIYKTAVHRDGFDSMRVTRSAFGYIRNELPLRNEALISFYGRKKNPPLERTERHKRYAEVEKVLEPMLLEALHKDARKAAKTAFETISKEKYPDAFSVSGRSAMSIADELILTIGRRCKSSDAQFSAYAPLIYYWRFDVIELRNILIGLAQAQWGFCLKREPNMEERLRVAALSVKDPKNFEGYVPRKTIQKQAARHSAPDKMEKAAAPSSGKYVAPRLVPVSKAPGPMAPEPESVVIDPSHPAPTYLPPDRAFCERATVLDDEDRLPLSHHEESPTRPDIKFVRPRDPEVTVMSQRRIEKVKAQTQPQQPSPQKAEKGGLMKLVKGGLTAAGTGMSLVGTGVTLVGTRVTAAGAAQREFIEKNKGGLLKWAKRGLIAVGVALGVVSAGTGAYKGYLAYEDNKADSFGDSNKKSAKGGPASRGANTNSAGEAPLPDAFNSSILTANPALAPSATNVPAVNNAPLAATSAAAHTVSPAAVDQVPVASAQPSAAPSVAAFVAPAPSLIPAPAPVAVAPSQIPTLPKFAGSADAPKAAQEAAAMATQYYGLSSSSGAVKYPETGDDSSLVAVGGADATAFKHSPKGPAWNEQAQKAAEALLKIYDEAASSIYDDVSSRLDQKTFNYVKKHEVALRHLADVTDFSNAGFQAKYVAKHNSAELFDPDGIFNELEGVKRAEDKLGAERFIKGPAHVKVVIGDKIDERLQRFAAVERAHSAPGGSNAPAKAPGQTPAPQHTQNMQQDNGGGTGYFQAPSHSSFYDFSSFLAKQQQAVPAVAQVAKIDLNSSVKAADLTSNDSKVTVQKLHVAAKETFAVSETPAEVARKVGNAMVAEKDKQTVAWQKLSLWERAKRTFTGRGLEETMGLKALNQELRAIKNAKIEDLQPKTASTDRQVPVMEAVQTPAEKRDDAAHFESLRKDIEISYAAGVAREVAEKRRAARELNIKRQQVEDLQLLQQVEDGWDKISAEQDKAAEKKKASLASLHEKVAKLRAQAGINAPAAGPVKEEVIELTDADTDVEFVDNPPPPNKGTDEDDIIELTDADLEFVNDQPVAASAQVDDEVTELTENDVEFVTNAPADDEAIELTEADFESVQYQPIAANTQADDGTIELTENDFEFVTSAPADDKTTELTEADFESVDDQPVAKAA